MTLFFLENWSVSIFTIGSVSVKSEEIKEAISFEFSEKKNIQKEKLYNYSQGSTWYYEKTT